MTVNYEIGKPRTDGLMRVTLLLCVGKTKKRIKTDILISKTDLNRKGKIRNDAPCHGILLDKIGKVIKDYGNLDTFLTGENITAQDAVARMTHKDIPTFFQYSEKWMERATMKGKKNYETAIRNFRAFTKSDIPFSMFSRIFLNDYLFSLKDKHRAQTLYFNAIKKIYTEAEKDYGITPFSSFRIDIPRQQRIESRALDVKTIRKIFSWNGKGKRASLARDCAILSFCLCGTNSADLYNAPTIRGNILSYNRKKTKDRRYDGAYIEIVIPRQIKELIKKYKGTSRAFSFHTMYSNESNFNKHLNKGLKTIGDDIGIENLTFYAFRHSWASIARNDLGIDKWTVHCALNHNDSDTAIDDVYIKKDFTQVNIANKKVVDYVMK